MKLKTILNQTNYFYKLAQQLSTDGTDLDNTTNLFYDTVLNECKNNKPLMSVISPSLNVLKSTSDAESILDAINRIYNQCVVSDPEAADKLKSLALKVNEKVKEKTNTQSLILQSKYYLAKANKLHLQLQDFLINADSKTFESEYSLVLSQVSKITDVLSNLESHIISSSYQTDLHKSLSSKLQNAIYELHNDSLDIMGKKNPSFSDSVYQSDADEIYGNG